MYLIRYKQPYVTWHPPDWPIDREIAMGREVAQLGKAELRKRFRQGHWLPGKDDAAAPQGPYSDSERGFTIPTQPATPKRKKVSDIISIVIAALLLIGGAVFALPVLLLALVSGVVLGVIIYVWYLASLGFAVARYDRWLSRCLHRYQIADKTSSDFQHVSSCPGCGQKLRFPAGKGQLRIHCPSCGHTSLHQS
jgi:ribosomal protein S27E